MADVAHSTTSITGGHSNAVAAGAAGFMSGTDKTALDAAAASKSGQYTRISAGTLTLGTGAVLSLADALFTGKVAGGRGDLQGASGVVGIVAGSFASSGAETGTGAGQAALGAAVAADRPYPVADFPGQSAYAQCVLLRADREPIRLIDMVPLAVTDATAEVYGYLAYRSDLGGDLKWRLRFYYRRAADGLEAPVTPTASLTSCWLEAPEILLSTGRPPGADLSLTVAGPAVSSITFGATGDVQSLGPVAVGASGKVADAAHVHPAQFIVARLCTTAPLAAYTYANGTAGVGATITINANGVLADIDGKTPVVGDLVLVQNGAAFADNWLYSVTSVGSVGTQAVLTRSTLGDTQAKVLGAQIRITEGVSRRGAVYEYCGNPSITFGTTALAGMRIDTSRGLNEYAELAADFDMQVLAVSTGQVIVGPVPLFLSVTGTASAAPRPGTATERGIFRLSATTTTGSAVFSLSTTAPPIMVTTEQYFEMEARFAGPSALSDGTDTYRILIGLTDLNTVLSTNGIWFEYTQVTDTVWLGTTRAAGASSTTTGSSPAGPTVTVNTYVRAKIKKYAGETTFHVEFNGVEAGTGLTTNQPLSVALSPTIAITKTIGNVNARTFDIDSYRVLQVFPNGRAA